MRHPMVVGGGGGSSVVRPQVVVPPRQHSRSSSLGSIANRVQPPAVPPREPSQVNT